MAAGATELNVLLFCYCIIINVAKAEHPAPEHVQPKSVLRHQNYESSEANSWQIVRPQAMEIMSKSKPHFIQLDDMGRDGAVESIKYQYHNV